MNIVEKISIIEKDFPLEDISFKGLPAWAVIRLYLSYHLAGKDPVKGTEFLNVKRFFYLFYGVLNYFRRYDFIAFTNASERRLLNAKLYDKLDFLPSEYKMLCFEQPIPGHYPRKNIPTRYIVSRLSVHGFVWLISKLVSGKIEPENQWLSFIEKEKIEINVPMILKRFYAQYLVGKLLFFLYKPKVFFVIPSFTNMGFVRAFREKGCRVVELQHGVINDVHIAYNYRNNLDTLSFPDYLFSYGQDEKKVFENNYFIPEEKVLPTGHFYLDWLGRNFNPNKKLLEILKKYDISIAFTAQTIIETKVNPLLFNIARQNEKVAFLYIPRIIKDRYDELTGKPENIIIVDWINCYEAILHADFHSTVYSTCSLEAPVLGKQNILIDFEGMAIKNYGKVLTDSKITVFVKTEKEFSEAIKSMPKISHDEIKRRGDHFIISDFKNNLKKNLQVVLNEYSEK